MADRGLVIASGFACGIDSCAHQGNAQSLTGATVGVLGCEIDVIYPKENKKILAEMEKRGRFRPNSRWAFPRPPELPDSEPHHFGTVRRCRGRRRREVYGVPDNATQPTSFGPNQLIKQGAKLVTRWEDVIEELPTPIRAELLPVETAASQEMALLVEKHLAPAEGTLYHLLGMDESRHVDDLVELSGLTSSEVLACTV